MHFYKSQSPGWDTLEPKTRQLLVECCSVNSAYNSQVVPPKKAGEQREQVSIPSFLVRIPFQVGNKTECALLGFVLDVGQSYEDIRRSFPEEKIHKVYTFNSSRKSMMTVIDLPSGGYRIYAKGASEIILSRCSYILGKDGVIERFTEKEVRVDQG